MANININSYNELLGNMIRKLVADTPVNDINTGSVLLTLLEAAAANDFDNNAAILNVLELLNIDSLRNNDLEAYASNLGLTRNTAVKASGFIRVTDSTITKRSTTLYAVRPAPIAGTSVLYVNDASDWQQTGTVYIGRGTPNFEGPLNYSSITDNGSFFAIQLDSDLEKDHLISEIVVDGQGTTDRQILSGTTVKVSANNISPEIEYSTLRDAVIPAGEDEVTGIPVVAVRAGSSGNAGINSITLFNTPPFSGARVTNTIAFTNGRDTETDRDFRDRVKAYSASLARGTKSAILAAIDGVSDEDEGKQVASAVITEPADIGEPSIVYIDDGEGFQPSFTGQNVDSLISSATGEEEFLQLSNFPLPRPQVVNSEDAPFELREGMELKIEVDEIEESILFTSDDFRSITSATLSEVIVAINNKSTLFKARFAESSNRILLYTEDYRAEKIKVVSEGGLLDANTQFRFPTNEFSYISLYKNNERLSEVERSASVISNPFSTWGIIAQGNIILSIDNTPDQDRSFDIPDFGGTNFSALTIDDWVEAFNNKFAGISATASSTGRLILTSNKVGSESSIKVAGGSYLNDIFGGQPLESTGQDSDFALNRQNGNLQLKTPLSEGDSLSAGSTDTKGAVTSASATGGTFNVSTDANGRPSEMVIVVDGGRVDIRPVTLAVGATITLSDQGSNVMRVMASSSAAFSGVQSGDFIYIANRGDSDGLGTRDWVDAKSSGLFKVITKGGHTSAGVDTYLEVINEDMSVGGPYTVQDSLDVQAFYSDTYPQVWQGTLTSNPASATISDVISSLNNNVSGVFARVFDTSKIRMTSVSESNGSVAVPVSVGNSPSQLFSTGIRAQFGSPSHIANKVQNKDVFTIFKRGALTTGWLGRAIYSDLNGTLTSAVEPSKDGSGTYSELLTDTNNNLDNTLDYNSSISITSGQNKQQIRNIQTIIDQDNVGTRNAIPRTALDYNAGDEYQIVKNLEISSEDSVVAILDDNASAKTVDISMSRTGRINSGSQSGTFVPTNLAFSADDADNEDGVDFGSLTVWGTQPNQMNANFNDYAVWFKGRNYYLSNGASMVIRSKEYGPIADKLRFNIEYPTVADSASSIFHVNKADSTLTTYVFGSSANISTNLFAGDQFTVTDLGSDNYRLDFPATSDVSGVSVGNVISIASNSGFSSDNQGSFRVNNKSDTSKYIDVYNPNGQATIVGSQEIQSVETVADASDSLDGTYFVVNAPNGDTIKFWFDNNDSGTVEPDIGTTTRTHEVNISINDADTAVATALAAVMLNDPAISTATTSGTNTITLTFTDNGPSTVAQDGTPATGFTFAIVTAGVADTFETLNVLSGLSIFSLTGTSTSDIVASIDDSAMLEAVEITAGNIEKATREETGVAVNEVAFGHDPDPNNGNNADVGMYDSVSYVIAFQNSNPNFQLKLSMDLVGASPVYDIDTVPNSDGTTGEYFKLVPTTIDNLEHQLTNRALSQLDIISDVDKSNKNKKLQIKSNELGSDGAVEIVGGRGNEASFKMIGSSQISTANGVDFLELKVPSSPNTIVPGQHVMLSNDFGMRRLNRQLASDSMDVVEINDSTFEYVYNHKTTNFNKYVEFSIVDANSVDPVSYPNPRLVWRWTHNDAGSEINIIDVADGAVANQPVQNDAAGTVGGATNIVIEINDPGSSSSKLDFDIIVTGLPAQADYITFENSSGSTWAVNIDIDANGTVPTGASYVNATNKVEVDILSTDTPNQIMSKIISELLDAGITTDFSADISQAATLSAIREGDLLSAVGTLTGWDNTNKLYNSGDNVVGGLPVVKVDASNKYLDVVNPKGTSMSSTSIGSSSDILISTTPIIEWRTAHTSRVEVDFISVSSGVATATTVGPHGLNVGDTFDAIDLAAAPDTPGSGTGTVASVSGINQFTFTTGDPDVSNVSPAGFVQKTGTTRTRYKIESLGYNDTYKLKRVSGDSPQFVSCGAAVDDLVKISGSTFNTINVGEFRVLAVDEDSIVYQNPNAIEELDTILPLNNFNTTVNWVSGSDEVSGAAGSFSNVSIGDWVKKATDDDTEYKQVVAFDTGVASTATVITLGANYNGVTATSEGVTFDQVNAVGTGKYLDNESDIVFYEGDSVRNNDELFISDSNNVNWFNTVNSGTFDIQAYGTDATSSKIFLRVNNSAGTAQTNVSMGIANTEFAITEGETSKFTTIKEVAHVAIDEFNPSRRVLYLTPGNREYKWSQTNSTNVSAIGKLGYTADLVTGIDGYLYYIGLLRRVQRIIDGFEPDAINFPGRKAVGSLIETLPPLPKRVEVAIDVTTRDGVNLSEISDEIKSGIISYIDGLGVGDDVILSDIIVRAKNIDGVAAVTFITPAPNNERISVSPNERAFIRSTDISIA